MNAMEIIGAIIVSVHVVGLTVVLLWMGLGMPVTVAGFRLRFRQMFFAHHPGSSHLH